jgi:hypothetical protein
MTTKDAATPQSPRVSSVAEEIRRAVGSITLVPPDGLHYWLPGLDLPVGWTIVSTPRQAVPVTRIALRRITAGQRTWDACEVVALYQFTGSVPEEVVQGTADRTLRDLGADNVLHCNVSPGLAGVAAVRSTGWFTLGRRSLWGQFSNYVVNVGAVGALVEHSVLVGAERRPRLAREVNELTQMVLRSLVVSLASSTHSEG